jgi:hypothetical protein
MWNNKFVGKLLVLPLAAFFMSCFNPADYEIKKIQASTNISLPLATGSLSIQDFLNKLDNNVEVKVYPDGLVYFQYVKSIEWSEIRSLLAFPSQTLNLTFPVIAASFPPSNVEVKPLSLTSSLEFAFSPEKLKEIQFKGTSLTVNVSLSPANPNFPFEIDIKLPSVSLNGIPFQKRVSGQSSFLLNDYIAFLNDNKFSVDLGLIVKPRANTVTIPAGSSLNVSLAFSGIDFKYVKGFLGDRTTAIQPQVFNVDAFGSALDKAKVSFADPRFSVDVLNDYGIPVRLTFTSLEARKKPSRVLSLVTNPASPIALLSPPVLGQQSTTSLSITNAKQITDLVPDEFYVAGNARINQGLTSGNNFCADTSKLRLKIKSEIPLYGSFSGIVLADTFDIDLTSIKSSEVETAALKAKITNELPLDATLQIYIADSKSIISDSIFTTAQAAIVVGSKANALGELQTAGVYDKEISLNIDKVNKLFAAKKLIVKSVMNTIRNSSGAAIDVKFKAAYKMDVAIGLKTQLKISRGL